MTCRARRLVASVAACTSLMLGLPLAAAPAAERASEEAVASTAATGAKLWSDPKTWRSGKVPGPDARVVVPFGSKIVLDGSPPPLGSLRVDGTLAFRDKDLSLSADWIVVHGTLKVGTESNPFKHRAVITLTGDDPSVDIMDMGTKVLGVMGGTLDLHGRRVKGWTRLAKTAQPGASTVTLAGDRPWKAGDRIVIASSDYWRRHDEERTVTAVSGRTLELDEPLEYQHWGTLQSFGGGTVDERAEVGVLTRNIVVQGNDASLDNGFGGHLMVMAGSTARIEGVEFELMGQRNRLRRYPVHFHMDGSASGSYLKRSSIHHTFNRCVVIHGTNHLFVTGNVCYDNVGHAFFLEDGAEHDNLISGNLGLGTKANEAGLLPTDDRPATFWITNPDNTVRNNVAAGSDGPGFWYALPEHPTGLSHDAAVWPRRTPLKEFSDNVAHSNGDSGVNVDDGPRPDGNTESTYYRPVFDPTDSESDTVTATFKNLTAYMNRDRGIWLRGENHVVTGAVLADNRSGATFASSESFLEDSLVVGETANMGTTEPWEDPGFEGRALPFFWEPDAQIVGFEFYDGRVGVRNTTFVGFNPNPVRPSGALGYLAPDAFSIHPKNFAEGIQFVDSNRVYLAPVEPDMDGDASKVFVDKDGSVTGSAGSTVVVDNPFLLQPGCAFRAEWTAHVCTSDYVTLLIGANNPNAIKPVTLERGDGSVQTLMGCCDDSTDAQTTAIPNRAYDVAFNGGTPQESSFVLWRGKGRWVELNLTAPPGSTVTRWGHPLSSVTSQSALDAKNDSAYFYNSATSTLHLKIVGNGDWEEIHVEKP